MLAIQVIQYLGSGIWLQQEDTYTELSEAETIVLTEDRTPVCVSSSGSAYTSWYYRGDSNTGVGERITDTELDSTKGFLKLNFPITLPSNRTGFYYCTSYENIDTRNTQLKDHSIRISLTTGIYTYQPLTKNSLDLIGNCLLIVYLGTKLIPYNIVNT